MLIKEPRCKKCSKPVTGNETEYCYDCSSKEFHYVRGYSLWMYDKVMKESMVAFKYKGRKEYAEYYVDELVKHLGPEIMGIRPDIIIPVPVHPSRRKKRGYNQAELLAIEFGRQIGVLVKTDFLIRTVKTRPQKELSDVERTKNLEMAFSMSETFIKENTKYQRILLIDDIYTTGSTVEACTRVLQAAGNREVYFVTICIGQGF